MNPSPEQALLLRASLSDGPAALTAWHDWKATVQLADVDRGSARLLPLLWHNLLQQGVTDPVMPRLKGVYRHTWFGNQLRARELRQAQELLAAADVESLVLKGVALAYAYYPNPGLRPMDDLDLLVRPADLSSAVKALRDAGWSSPIRRPERVQRVVHATEFQNSAGERLDIHGHLFQGSLHSEMDRRRWERSRQVAGPDGPLRVLDPTDQLLHVLVHGAESDPPALRWLADSTMVLRRDGDAIDWERLLDEARAEGRELAVTRALAELQRQLEPGIPPAVLHRLGRRRFSLAERLEHRIAAGPRVFTVGYLLQRYVDYRRWRRTGDPARGRTGFAGYLRFNWDLDAAGQLPAQVVRRGVRTLGSDVSRLLAQVRPARHPGDGSSGR
jgi:hypothetical protein